MSRGLMLLIGLAAVVLVLTAAVLLRPAATPGPGATPSGSLPPGATPPAGTSSPTTGSAAPTASATPTTGATETPGDAPSAQAGPGGRRVRYAEFLLRVNEDRAEVERLNAPLAAAAEDGDLDAVRTSAVAILDFVDRERDWLRNHPPARCYRDAHAAADEMLIAYGSAADRFIDWTTADGGLDGLAALTDAFDAASQAGDALTAFGQALEATSCA